MLEPQPGSVRLNLWLRGTGLLIGFLFLVWLPFEDTDVFFTVTLAAVFSAWLLFRFLLNKEFSPMQFALSGTLAGLLLSPLAITMMAFKSGVHAHGFSDFALPQIRAVLFTTPWFILGGLLLGLMFRYFLRQA